MIDNDDICVMGRYLRAWVFELYRGARDSHEYEMVRKIPASDQVVISTSSIEASPFGWRRAASSLSACAASFSCLSLARER